MSFLTSNEWVCREDQRTQRPPDRWLAARFRLLFSAGCLAVLLSFPIAGSAEIVAEVYGNPIDSSELEPPASLSERIKATGSVDYEAWTTGYKRGKFVGLLMGRVREERTRNAEYAPTAEEVEAVVRLQVEAGGGEAKGHAERAVAAEHVTGEEPSPDLEKTEQQGEPTRASTEQDALPAETSTQARDNAAAQIAAWKLRRSLYAQYGGRVVVQGTDYEPVDAYKRCLEDLVAAGDIAIRDPAYAGVLNDLDRYLTTRRNFATDEDAKNYFASPWWETRPQGPSAGE